MKKPTVTAETAEKDKEFSAISARSAFNRRIYFVQSPRRFPEYFMVISWPWAFIFMVPV